MNRQEKEQVIQGLKDKFLNSQATFVVQCQGLAVSDLHSLRLDLAKKDSELKVAKNRLVKLALAQESDCPDLGASMQGQTAVVFVKSDFTGAAKVLYDFAKKNEDLKIIAGCCESRVFDKAGVVRLASIPSREVLLAQLCGVIKAPTVKLVWVLAQIAAKKSEGAESEVANNAPVA